MGWHRCLELLAIVLCAGGALAALTVAIVAVVRGYRHAAKHRNSTPAVATVDKTAWSEEQKATAAAHWLGWRQRMAGYGADLNLIANPLRRDAIEIVKESSQWGRLGVQYALIANGGALAALPYLLSQNAATYSIELRDAAWSAAWFTVGLSAAALCCLIAYLDFQVNAAAYWAQHRLEVQQAQQRHFESEEQLPYESHSATLKVLYEIGIKTTLAGVVLAFIAWFALAWGAVRLIASMAP